ncbi:uncharacterized protein [Atheta coriaria]|uniref:uncharacterized protein isoform X2 n=1 Tax=Dalotia coriaria TaxID=877792 RepID=UPI0031F393AD
MRVLPILLLLTSNFNHIRGKTNLLFANVTGTGENAKVQATCVSDDYNDAIAWITAPFTELIEPISANETLRYINFNWGKYGWNEEVAYNATFGPVMDYTWEMLPIIITRSAQLTQNYKFEKLEEIKIRNHFELNFSFLGKSSAQIYLCSHPMIKRD